MRRTALVAGLLVLAGIPAVALAYPPATVTVGQDSATIQGLDCGTQYEFRVREWRSGAWRDSQTYTRTTSPCPEPTPTPTPSPTPTPPPAPTASFTYSPDSSATGESVTFDASGSSCPQAPCSYVWEDTPPGGSVWPLGTGETMSFTFSGAGTKYVRLTVTGEDGQTATTLRQVVVTAATPTPTPTPEPTPEPTPTPTPEPTPTPTSEPTPTPTPDPGGLPPLGQPSCVAGAVDVTTAAAAQSNLAAGRDVCVTANIGSLTLSSGTAYTSTNTEHLGTTGDGLITSLFLNGADYMNVRVRALHVTIHDGHFITLEQSRIGGTQTNKEGGGDALNLRDTLTGCDDCIVQDNDIGWMRQSETSGNSGYCIRAFGNNDRLKIQRNWIHECEADGIQGMRGDDVLVDRNEIGPVGDDPNCTFGGLCEHSDGIQEHGRDGTIRITNNWIHHEGYRTNPDGTLAASRAASGTTYVHGGSTTPIFYENNLVETSRGRVEFCGLGTGGYSNNNATIRRNTFRDLARAFGIQGFDWDCTSGTGNLLEGNVFSDNGGGIHDSGQARTFTNNAVGSLSSFTYDSDGNCTSLNCVDRGFRKPAGVHW